jgi:SAM-dependent methyltransferase
MGIRGYFSLLLMPEDRRISRKDFLMQRDKTTSVKFPKHDITPSETEPETTGALTKLEEWNKDFLGGPPELFDRVGREQLIVLLEHGLTFSSYVLDIGCGCLRGGRWIIPLLDKGHYCGVEPQPGMVSKGLKQFIDPDMLTLKEPKFDYNERFDFSVFGHKFTHFMARSIWSHASKPQIELMLDGVAAWGEPNSVLLASFFRSFPLLRRDYQGHSWVGESHESESVGVVAHDFKWIKRACQQRGLSASIMHRPRVGGQIWAVVRKVK